MAAPSRYHQVLSDQHWQAAFGRQTSVESVLQYVLDHWARLQKHPPQDMKFSSHEPRITRFFALSLRKNARNHGISGLFTPEAMVGDIDEIKQELESPGRTDIHYFSDRTDPAINFVLEFKKLKLKPGGSKSRLEYCSSGVLRFVNATYARDTDFGFMVGLVDTQTNRRAILNALKGTIQHPDMVQLLKTIKTPSGQPIATADLKFSTSDFETRHGRDHVHRSDVLLGHFLLTHSE
jgi:hypothetical protein